MNTPSRAMGCAAAAAFLLGLASAPGWAQSSFVFPADTAAEQQQAAPATSSPASLRLRYAPEEGQYPADAESVRGFVSPDKWIITRYFEVHRDKQIRARGSRSLMPRDLPKGLTEKPKQGDILPPFEANSLPAPLLRDLPHLPQGVVRLVAGHDVILLRQRNNEVIDVLEKVIR